MAMSALKTAFRGVLDANKTVSIGGLRSESSKAFYDFERSNASWSMAEKNQPWTDDELRVVLSDAPTRDNVLKHARAFKRGLGSIEQIYRWAVQPVNVVNSKRADNKFTQQVRRISKELGWLS
jgi:hypothetical protein